MLGKYIHTIVIAISTLTLLSCRPVGVPSSIVSLTDGDNKVILSGDRQSGKVWQMNQQGWKTGSTFLCSSIIDIATNGKDRVWVLGSESDGQCRLYELSYPGMQTIQSLAVGRGAASVTYDKEDDRLWVACRDLKRLWEVDIMRWSVVGKLDMPREASSVAIRDSLLYVAGRLPEMVSGQKGAATSVCVFDKRRSALRKTINLPKGSVLTGDMVANGRYAYLTHVLSRYTVPAIRPEHGWIASSALSVIDMDSMKLIATVLLDSPARGAAGAGGMAVSPDGKELAIALSGINSVMVIDLDGLHARLKSYKTADGRPIHEDLGFLYGLRRRYPSGGRGTGTLLYLNEHTLLAGNLYSGNITVISDRPRRFRQVGRAITSTEQGRGEAYFSDATLSYQGWLSCASCHGADGRSDALTHIYPGDSIFGRFLTPSLAGVTYRSSQEGLKSGTLAYRAMREKQNRLKPSRRKGEPEVLPIEVTLEEMCFEAIRSHLFTEPQDGEAHALASYISSLEHPRSPYLKNGRLSARAEAGLSVYESLGCASCHNDEKPLIGLWKSAPYMHDGRMATLEEVINSRHGMKDAKLTATQKRDLKEYLLTL
ncbi:MAG: hypothetical protein K2N21_00450 [Rikenellaceae bacterium]|nr:hypothetical protein [Rikenellaceae bacterium]